MGVVRVRGGGGGDLHAPHPTRLHGGVRVQAVDRGRYPLARAAPAVTPQLGHAHVGRGHPGAVVGVRGQRPPGVLRVLLVVVVVALAEVGLGREGHGPEAAVGVGEERLGEGDGRAVGPLHASPSPVVALLEHVVEGGVQGPEVALALAAALPRHLDEALVEGEVVADGVLPALLVLLVVGELVDDELVDAAEGQPLLARLLDGHGDESHVAVRGFDVRVREAVRLLRALVVAAVAAAAAAAFGDREAAAVVVGVCVVDVVAVVVVGVVVAVVALFLHVVQGGRGPAVGVCVSALGLVAAR